MREDDGSREKIAHTPKAAAAKEKGKEEEKIDMSDMMAEIKEIAEVRRKDVQKAKDDGLRVVKKARLRPLCCACEERPGVNRNGTCAYEHRQFQNAYCWNRMHPEANQQDQVNICSVPLQLSIYSLK